MDKNTIRKEINALVNSIKNQSDTLAIEKYPSQVDLELFLHKVEKLYQKSIVFNHLSLFDGFEEKEVELKEAPDQAKKEVIQEKIIPASPEILIEKPVVSFVPPEEMPVIPTPPVTPPPPIDKASEPKKEEHRIPVTPPKMQGPDLKSFMGINDKFQFTNELFKGNMQEFNIVIEQLNNCETKDSAIAYLGGLQRLYSWDEEQETVKRFFNLVEKKYN